MNSMLVYLHLAALKQSREAWARAREDLVIFSGADPADVPVEMPDALWGISDELRIALERKPDD